MAAAASLSYFHGNISKKDCEILLGTNGMDGTYLVRQSETIADALCLSIFFKNIVYTYRIFCDRRGRFMVQAGYGVKTKPFKCLPDLIDHFKKPGKGLVTRLLYPLEMNKAKNEDKDNIYENLDDPDYVEVIPS